MNNKIFVAVFISLVVGFGIGYLVWGISEPTSIVSENMVHQMPDGSLMSSGASMSMEDMMKGMMVGLEGKTGDAFDKEFLSEMIVHHEGAVAMAQLVLMNSKRPELIKLAHDIITAQTSEITMMQQWQNNWFK